MGMTVAIDGPAAAGKGTIARGVAAHFGFEHLDTGLLYRAVARRVLDGVSPLEAAETLRAADFADAEALRTPDVAQEASRVAAMPDVRTALVGFQRAFARRQGGAVLDGRDIGTVICPDAEVKLFVTATDAARAERRCKELRGKGYAVTLEAVAADLAERDRRDAARATAPMSAASDAMVLDTTSMSIEQALAAAIAAVDAVRRGRVAENPVD